MLWRAARSPSALALGGAGIGIGLLAGLPLVTAAGVAATAYGAGAAISLLRRRRPRGERIDPFTVGEPWRGPVKGAMQAAARYRHVLGSMPPGPLRERLADIARSIDRGVEECWRVAQRGHALTRALAALDPAEARSRLAAAGTAAADEVVRSLEAQVASAERLQAVADQARQRLVVLEARLHEAVATAVELSLAAGEAPDAGRLGAEVDDVVDQLSALRSALDEAGSVGQ